jgi:hypothetical protein
MSDPIIIERSELRNIVDIAINATLTELGIKKRLLKPYMSQNQAAGLIGRSRLKMAMDRGSVRFHKKDPDKKHGRVYVSAEDVRKLLNNPLK